MVIDFEVGSVSVTVDIGVSISVSVVVRVPVLSFRSSHGIEPFGRPGVGERPGAPSVALTGPCPCPPRPRLRRVEKC